MKVTSTINFSKSANGWAGIKKHVQHDPKVKHSNQDIFKELTQYNVSGSVFSAAEIDQKMNAYFGDYVKQHDQKAINNRHLERVYGSVKKFLNSKKKITVVATVGDMETRNQLIKQLCPKDSYESVEIPSSPDGKTLVITDPAVAKKFYGVYEKALTNFVSTNYKINGTSVFNYLVPGAYSVHVDEAGAPHIHYELYATGKTRNGRVSNSLNQTLVNLYERATGAEKANGREALKWFRSVFDRQMANSLNNEFKRVYGPKFGKLELYRKGTHDVGRSMEQVKHLNAQVNQSRKDHDQLEHLRRKLGSFAEQQEPTDESYVAAIASPEATVHGVSEESFYKTNWSLEDLINWLKDFMKKVEKRLTLLHNREKALERREQTLNQQEQQLKTRQPEYQQKMYENAVKLLMQANNNRDNYNDLFSYSKMQKEIKQLNADQAFDYAVRQYQKHNHGLTPAIELNDPDIRARYDSVIGSKVVNRSMVSKSKGRER